MTSIWIVVGILLIVALACAAVIGWYGNRQAEENSEPMSTDQELSYALRPRALTAKEMHDATLKGALSYIRIPVK